MVIRLRNRCFVKHSLIEILENSSSKVTILGKAHQLGSNY